MSRSVTMPSSLPPSVISRCRMRRPTMSWRASSTGMSGPAVIAGAVMSPLTFMAAPLAARPGPVGRHHAWASLLHLRVMLLHHPPHALHARHVVVHLLHLLLHLRHHRHHAAHLIRGGLGRGAIIAFLRECRSEDDAQHDHQRGDRGPEPHRYH